MPTQDQPTHGRFGVAVVEMALILPVFLAFAGGLAEFGRAMSVTQTLHDAARDGARLAAAGSSNNAVRDSVRETVQARSQIPADAIQVEIAVAAAPGNPDPGNLVENAQPKDTIQIRIEVPGQQAALIAGRFLGDVTLRGQGEQRK